MFISKTFWFKIPLRRLPDTLQNLPAGLHKIFFVWYPKFFLKNLSYEMRDCLYKNATKIKHYYAHFIILWSNCMSMGPCVYYRAGTWLIDEWQLAFFMSCLMLRNLEPPFFVVIFFLICLTINNLSGILDTTDTNYMQPLGSMYLGLVLTALRIPSCPIFKHQNSEISF